MPTYHLIIEGKVQGVFFRANAKEKADTLGVTGWVKNTWQGNVEAIISGDEQSLKKFIEWCKIGPSRANVINIIIEAIEENEFDGFVILR